METTQVSNNSVLANYRKGLFVAIKVIYFLKAYDWKARSIRCPLPGTQTSRRRTKRLKKAGAVILPGGGLARLPTTVIPAPLPAALYILLN